MPTRGGPSTPVQVISDSDLVQNGGNYRLRNGPAIPVEGIVASDSRPVRGGTRTPVYIVSDSDIHVTRKLTGGYAIPMIASTVGPVAGGVAIPVYVTAGSLGVSAYTTQFLTYNPTSFWPLSDDLGATVAINTVDAALNGAYIATLLGEPGIGDGDTAARFDGVNDGVDIYSADLESVWDGDEFTIGGWFKIDDPAIYTDGVIRYIVRLRGNASNDIAIIKNSGSNEVRIQTVIGGTTLNAAYSYSSTEWTHFLITHSLADDEERRYLNGVQVGSTLTGLAAWSAGGLQAANCMLGAFTNTISLVWEGLLAKWGIVGRALTGTEVGELYSSLS